MRCLAANKVVRPCSRRRLDSLRYERGTFLFLENYNYAGQHSWLKIKLSGTKSNRTALGARVVVTTGARQQVQAVLSQSRYYSHDDLRLHFGLGEKTKAERVTIYWPSGQVEVASEGKALQRGVLKEGVVLSPK